MRLRQTDINGQPENIMPLATAVTNMEPLINNHKLSLSTPLLYRDIMFMKIKSKKVQPLWTSIASKDMQLSCFNVLYDLYQWHQNGKTLKNKKIAGTLFHSQKKNPNFTLNLRFDHEQPGISFPRESE